MKKDINEIFQKILEKIAKALKESNFSTCASLSTEMLRMADYLDFADGVFLGEFLESLFLNLNSINRKYVIDEKKLNNLKEDIDNLLSSVKDSLPESDEAKVNLFNSIIKARASVTKLQLESFRGEITKKKSKGIPGLTDERIGEILENLGESE